MEVFDEKKLVRELDQLPIWLRVAFATACAERLLPQFVAYGHQARISGEELAQILEAVWASAEAGEVRVPNLKETIERWLKLLPSEDEAAEAGVPFAMDAGAAAVYALRALSEGSSQEAAWAARRAYDAVDRFAQDSLDIDLERQDAEQQLLSFPAVQRELARQRRALDALRDIAQGRHDRLDGLRQLRRQSREDSSSVFE
jgi:uncharacterized protein YjaG (DUF416 family)